MALFPLAFSSYIRSVLSSYIRSAFSSYIRSAFSSYIANFNFNCRQESIRSAEPMGQASAQCCRVLHLMSWKVIKWLAQLSLRSLLQGMMTLNLIKCMYGNMLGMAKRAGMHGHP